VAPSRPGLLGRGQRSVRQRDQGWPGSGLAGVGDEVTVGVSGSGQGVIEAVEQGEVVGEPGDGERMDDRTPMVDHDPKQLPRGAGGIFRGHQRRDARRAEERDRSQVEHDDGSGLALSVLDRGAERRGTAHVHLTMDRDDDRADQLRGGGVERRLAWIRFTGADRVGSIIVHVVTLLPNGPSSAEPGE
jgi:hypothetical protein